MFISLYIFISFVFLAPKFTEMLFYGIRSKKVKMSKIMLEMIHQNTEYELC